MVAQRGLTQIAQVWGRRDFAAASAFADELSGSRRSSYLTGLAQATGRMSTDELLDWISGYRSDPAYPRLVSAAAKRLAQQDADAAFELVAQLPAESRAIPYASMLPMLAMQNPEKAMEVLIAQAVGGALRDLAVEHGLAGGSRYRADVCAYQGLPRPPVPGEDHRDREGRVALEQFPHPCERR